MNKRLLAALLILAMAIGLLSGCKAEVPEEEAMAGEIVEDQEEETLDDEQEKESDEKEESSEKEEEEEDQPEEKPDEEDKSDEEGKSDEEDKSNEKEEQSDDKKPDQETSNKDEQPGKDEPEQKPNEDDAEKEDDPVEEEKEPEGDQNTPPKEEELANLYQSSTPATVISYTGKTAKNSKYSVSKPIEVQGGDRVTFGPVATAQVVMGYTYDKSGKPLQIINAHTATEEAVLSGGLKFYTYTAPAESASVKFSVHNDNKGDYVLTRNHPFTLEEYSTLSGILPDFVEDALKNRDGLFVGDSICIATRDERMSGVRGWPRRIADEYGMNAVNNGKSGVSVSSVRVNSHGTVLTQLLEKKTQDFDYVVLHGGVNDAWSKADVGVMEEGFDPDTFDPDTYAGGLELLIYNAILHYGENASIGYLINFRAPFCEKGYVSDMTAYNEVGKKICEKWGITYFDMYNHEQITKELKMNTLTHTTDYIHPSSSGYDIISPYIADYMKTMLPCKQEILKKVLEEK